MVGVFSAFSRMRAAIEQVLASRAIVARWGARGWAQMESLEVRALLSAVFWDGGAGTANWADANNWSNDAIPTAGDDVTIEVGGADPTIVVSSGARAVRSLVSNEALQISGGSLSVGTTARVDGGLSLSGTGSLIGGTWLGSGGLAASGGTLNGVALDCGASITGTVNVRNGLVVNGELLLNGTSSYGVLSFNSTQVLGGVGSIVFAGSMASRIYLRGSGSPAALTIGSGLTVDVQHDGEFWAYTSDDQVINEATVQVDGALTELTLVGRQVNRGLLRMVDGGTVEAAGTLSMEGGGAFDSREGLMKVTGALENTGKTLALTGETGSLLLEDWGRIRGGVITCSGGGGVEIDAGEFEGVSLGGDVYVKEGQWLNIRGGLQIGAGVTLHVQTSDSSGEVSFVGTQSVSGLGRIAFDGSAGVGEGRLIAKGGGSPGVITIGPGITVVATHDGVLGQSSGNDSWINQGTICAEGVDVTLRLEGKDWVNQGRLESRQGATLELGGTFTTVGMGVFDGREGTILVVGTLDNTGDTLGLSAETGSLCVGSYYGTIKGGTISTGDGAQLYFGDGTLDGVVLEGQATVKEMDFGRGMKVRNGLVLNGIIAVVGGGGNVVTFEGTQTVSGGGQILLSGEGVPKLFTRDGSVIVTITIGPEVTIRATADAAVHGYTSKDYFVIRGPVEVDSGATLTLNSRVGLELGAGAYLGVQPGAVLQVEDDLLGGVMNRSAFGVLGKIEFTGGTSGAPSHLEVMGSDLGAVSGGLKDNFACSAIELGMGAYVQLVDWEDNSSGSGAEAMYVNSLEVPSGATLDLNGLHVYARVAKIGGTVINGTVGFVADGGALSVNLPAMGSISAVGQVDEWTFYGWSGREMTVVVNPGTSGVLGALSPVLGYASVTLLDGEGNEVWSGGSVSSGGVVEASGVVLPSTGNYRVRVQAGVGHASNTGSYGIALWDVTGTRGKLLLNQDTMGRIDSPHSVNRWTFSAGAGQQVRLQLLNTANPSLAFELSGPNDWIGLSGQVGSSDVVTLPSDGVYTLTASSPSGAYNIPFVFCVEETAVTDLSMGLAYVGQFAGSGQARLFRVVASSAAPLRVVLDGASAVDQTELYVSFGQPPTRGVYDYCSRGGADQEVLVPLAAAGTWYALVYTAYAQGGSGYSVRASGAEVVLAKAMPSRVGNSAPATLTVTGAGFDGTTTVELVAGGSVIGAASVSHDAFTQMTATFGSGLPVGSYTIRALRGDGAWAEIPGGLTVVSGGHAELDTRLILPSRLGYHALDTIYVEYRNTGELAMPAPLLVLRVRQKGEEGALLTLEETRLSSGFWTSAMPQGFSHSVKFLASGETPGVLLPGESRQVPVYWAGWLAPWDMEYPDFDFELTPVYADDTEVMNWDLMKESLKPGGISAEAWSAICSNLTSVLPTWGSYVSMLDDNASYLGRLGERVVDVSELWNYELMQANGFGFLEPLVEVTDASVDSPGLRLEFVRSFGWSITGRYELGRLGRGWYDNWDYRLERSSDGTVAVRLPGGGLRVFQPDVRGGYVSGVGEYGRLAEVEAGVFCLREKDGVIRAFLADGNLGYVEDASGNRITCGYTSGRLTSLVHSSGESLSLSYGAAGRIEGVSDSHGRSAAYGYDGSGEHLASVAGFDGRPTGYAYETGGGLARMHALKQVDYAGGVSRLFAYDSQGRLASSSLSGGAEAEVYSYDSAGTMSVTDAAGGVWSTCFNANGLPVKYVDGLGQNVVVAYDRGYNVAGVTDSAGRSYRARYDDKGNMTSWTDPLGATAQYSYTVGLSRLSSVIDANGNRTRYGYDGLGNLTLASYADGSSDRWVVNSNGQVTEATNGRGNTTVYTYDWAGRLLSMTCAGGSKVEYTYDDRGNLKTMADGLGLTTYSYDSHGWLERVDYSGGQWLAFTYTEAGRRASRADQTGHVVNYYYDAAGRPSHLTDELGVELARYSYDEAGRVVRTGYGNGVYTTYGYDIAGRLEHLVNRLGDGTVVSRFDYGYDSRGRRISMGTVDGEWAYSYDDAGRLVHAVLTSTNGGVASQDLAYVYDAMGNRTQTVINGEVTVYAVNAMNQYTFVGETEYTYDADGNLVSSTGPGGTAQYTYDDDNLLTAVVWDGGSREYLYNGLGQCVGSVGGGVTSRYVIDPWGIGYVAGGYGADGGVLAVYDYGRGLVSSRDGGGTRSYFTTDALGSVTEMTSQSGAVLSGYSYLPFGGTLRSTGVGGNVLQFIGGRGVMTESDGLLSMRRRFYSVSTGRFLSEDPAYIAGENTYTYALNRPTMLIDPTGLRSKFGGSSWGDDDSGDSSGSGSSGGTYHGREWNKFGDKGNQSSSSSGSADSDSSPGWDWSHPWDSLKRKIDHWFGNDGPDPNKAGGKGSSSKSSGSRDPNEKAGPGGYGVGGYIRPGALMPYRVDFENDASATAPAQYVTIEDALSANLDWSSFRFTQFGFGGRVIMVEEGAQHFDGSVSVTYNERTFDVQIRGDLDLEAGRVRVQFMSVDPSTGLPPAGQVGFLPPEDGSGRGMGHFCFTVNAKEALTTGEEIRNVGVIQFDMGEIIATNQVAAHDPSQGTDPGKECLNTVDGGSPVSQVAGLPASVATAAFAVEWGGVDDEGGCGVAWYDVYVSDNGGDYARWLTGTTATSGVYSGEDGHRYAFYCIASDGVGNREAGKASAEATTLVKLPPIVRFKSAKFSVSEKSKTATITVTRGGDRAKAVSVKYATVTGGTAKAGTEYKAVSGVLKFAAGQTSKTFAVPIIDDTVAEVSKTVKLLLSSPGNGAVLGTTKQATLTIVDNDDAVAPTGSLGKLGSVVKGAATYRFSVTYTDNVSVKRSTLGLGDILVTGPKSFSQLAALVSTKPTGDGKTITATYEISAPGGSWNRSDNGTYAMWLEAGQVSDLSGKKSAKKQLGSLKVALP